MTTHLHREPTRARRRRPRWRRRSSSSTAVARTARCTRWTDSRSTIAPGELVALLGPSGCGKTTALRAVAGLEQLDEGRVLVGGDDITHVPPHRRNLGMVFQAYSLFPNMNALENVAFGLEVRRVAAAERHKRAGELLELVGLAPLAERYPHELSGGQQQRVALARALCVEPRLLLLDEPLSALDAKVRAQLRDEIRRIQLEVGITTLFVTHDQEEALSMADRVGVMRAGQPRATRPAGGGLLDAGDQLRRRVRRLRQPAAGRGGGPGHRRRPRLADWRSPPVPAGDLPAGSQVDVLVRPESIRIRPASRRAGGGRPRLVPRGRGPGRRHPARRRRGDLDAAGERGLHVSRRARVDIELWATSCSSSSAPGRRRGGGGVLVGASVSG